jgi:hypothetical protein
MSESWFDRGSQLVRRTTKKAIGRSGFVIADLMRGFLNRRPVQRDRWLLTGTRPSWWWSQLWLVGLLRQILGTRGQLLEAFPAQFLLSSGLSVPDRDPQP